MKIKTIQTWVVFGAVEVLLSLILIAAAPRFLNSDKPMVGFLIWLIVPTLLGSSGVYVAIKLADAQTGRKLFLAKFPEYEYLKLADFLELSSADVAQRLELLEAIKDDPDFQQLCISPLDFLNGAKKQ